MADLKEFALKKGIKINDNINKPNISDDGLSANAQKVDEKEAFKKPIGKRRPWLSDENSDSTPEKVETNWRQTEDKVETKNPQKIKSGDKVETKPRTQPETKWRQTEDKVETICDFSSLVGLQRKLLLIVYFSIRKNQSTLSEQLSVDYLAQYSESSSSSVKKTMQRLGNKGFLNRESFKNGRGGWTIYSIPKSIYQDLLHNETGDKLETKWRQTEDKVGTKLETEPRTSPPCSSSNINNISTTTEDDLWDNLNFDEVSEFRISRALLNRVLNKNPELDFEAVSKFLNRLPQRLKDPKKQRINNPIGFFIDCLNQIARGEEPLADIVSDDEKLLEKMIKEKKESMLRKKALEEELFELEFTEWESNLDAAQKLQICPETSFSKLGSQVYRQTLKSYYRENMKEFESANVNAKNLSI